MSDTKPTYEELEQRLNNTEALLRKILPDSNGEHLEQSAQSMLAFMGNFEQMSGMLQMAESEPIRLLFEAMPFGLTMENKDGRLLYVNGRFLQLTGYTRDELRLKSITDFTPPGVENIDQQYFQQLIAGQIKDYQVEKPLLCKDGSTVWCHIGVSGIYNAQGDLLHLVSMLYDITEMRQMKLTVNESEARFRSLFEQSQDGIVLADEEGRVVLWNEANVTISGISIENAIGQYVWDIQARLVPDDSLRHSEKIKRDGNETLSQAVQSGQLSWPNLIKATIQRPDGTRRFLQQQTFMIKTEKGSMMGNISRDITDIRKAEEVLVQSQKLAEIGALMAGIAHEMKSPLQVIDNIGDSLACRLEKGNIDIQRALLDLRMHKRNTQRISRMMGSLMQFSRSVGDEFTYCDLNDVMSDTLILIEHQLRVWSNIDVVTNLTDGMPQLYCDRNKLSQVLINLLTNARDAMPSGGQVTITTHPDTLKNELVVEVTDTGEGIALEAQRHIFDPFFTTKMAGKGTGLGLSIVAGIMRELNGTISVVSTPGNGAQFILCFPVPETLDPSISSQ